MKKKSDLKRKVLCSLLAASTMGIFYSSDALAASVNGVNPDLNNDGIITDAELVGLPDGKGSHHFIVGQSDKITIATNGDVNQLLQAIATSGGDLDAIRAALAEHANIGVIGGEAKLDDATFNSLGLAAIVLGDNEDLQNVLKKVLEINTIGRENNTVTINEDTNLIIGDATSNPVVIGMVGGDLAINPSLDFNEMKGNQVIEITRNGTINNTINSGNVIGGVGGSTAISMGNISGSMNVIGEMPIISNGKTTITINGDINTVANANGSVGAFANGGAAIAIGGEANSVVNGDTNFYINGYEVNEDGSQGDGISMTKGVNGVAAGLSGGGVAVTTIGGTATSTVNGNTNIIVTDSIVGAVIGGGVAASVDATGVAEAVLFPDKQIGNNVGYSDVTDEQLEALLGMGNEIPDATIVINNVVQGGTAKATTKDTNITLEGTSTGVGVIGGGLAAAAHTYTVRPENEGGALPDGYEVNDEYGKSVATAETGRATINVALDSSNFNRVDFMEAISGMKDAVSSIAGGSEFAGLDAAKEALKGAANQGAVAGVFGGGMAVSQSGNRNNLDDEGLNDQGAFATANTAGADINLHSGYAAGVFGGGVAAAINNSHAEANMTDTVNINVYNTMNEEDKNTVIGIFGNGLAYYTGSYKTSTGENANLEGAAKVTAKDTNINVDGMVDGIVNGGLAIDDSEADTTNAIVSTETGTINIGSSAVVNAINFDGFTDLVGKVPADKIDMASYVAGVGDAADGVAVAAGGVAVGGGAESTVKNAEVNVFGTVNGDIIGGGVAAYGFDETNGDGEAKGAHVENSTLNLYTGANITGDVYAGGSASDMTKGGTGYDKAQAIVDNATINLAGATVSGVLTGAGVSGTDNDVALNSTLNLIGENTLSLIKGESEGVQDSSKFDGFIHQL